jgi:tRNA 5-methylaminomethyl-2-thiouridine biosynthesis bifunctional protein
VLDQAATPAAGASALPAGLLAPHHSADDGLLSRLSRCGVRMTLDYARSFLPEGDDWRFSGVLEHRPGTPQRPTIDASEAAQAWTRPADASQKAEARLPDDESASWHQLAAWIRPAALVRAWLGEPGIQWRGRSTVRSIGRSGALWRVHGADGELLAEAELVVVAAAYGSLPLLEAALPLQPVRGQVSWAFQRDGQQLPGFPVNGHGHFIPAATVEGATAWLCGSTYERRETDRSPREADHQFNLGKLRALLPAVAEQLAPDFSDGSVQAWTGVRCVSADRRPYVGELQPGLWASTAMGSRGLTFALLCAELLAARLHQEPLPLEQRLAQALDTARTLA